MNQFLLILLWIFVMWGATTQINLLHKEEVGGKTVYNYAPFFAILVFIPIIIWAGLRGDFQDTGLYRELFREMPEAISGMGEYLQTVDKDLGFSVFSIILKSVIGNRDVLYFFIIALIQGGCLIYVYRKYSTNYILSILLFILSTDYISWMFNGIRQFLAVAVWFACFPLLLKRKYISLIAIILILSTIHGSAVLLLPLIFIVQGKAWNKKTLFFIACALLAIIFVDSFTTILDDVLASTQYEDLVSSEVWQQDDGTNIIRVLVYAVPTILALIGRKQIKIADNKIINICVNMSLLSTGIYLVSMFTSGILIGRLPIYFSLYNYILIPWEIENIFTVRSRKLLYPLMIGAYLVFYYYQLNYGWGIWNSGI